MERFNEATLSKNIDTVPVPLGWPIGVPFGMPLGWPIGVPFGMMSRRRGQVWVPLPMLRGMLKRERKRRKRRMRQLRHLMTPSSSWPY